MHHNSFTFYLAYLTPPKNPSDREKQAANQIARHRKTGKNVENLGITINYGAYNTCFLFSNSYIIVLISATSVLNLSDIL